MSIKALTRPIAALEKKGVADSDFFQSGVGHAIRKVAMSSEKVSDVEPAPPSGDIFRILKQITDEVSANLATLKAEEDRKANHAGFVEVMKKEMATSTVTTRARLTWQGELAVEVVKAFSKDRVQQRTVKQVIVTPATSLAEKIADVPNIQTQEKIIQVTELRQKYKRNWTIL